MRSRYHNIIRGMLAALLVAAIFGAGQPANAQTFEEELFNKLDDGQLDRIAASYGKEGTDVTGLVLCDDPDTAVVEPIWETIRYSIDNVVTTEADTPLIIAEQYSTNCTSGDMERSFAFSKTQDHTYEVHHDYTQGISVSSSISVGFEDILGASVDVGFEISKDYSHTWGDSTSETESTTWDDTVSVTLPPGTVGRGRLLVTENKANVNFTQYVRVKGTFFPTFAENEGTPPDEVCFYKQDPSSNPSATLKRCGTKVPEWDFNASAEYLRFVGTADTRIELFSRKNYTGTTIALQYTGSGNDNTQLPAGTKFCNDDKSFCYQKTAALTSPIVEDLHNHIKEGENAHKWWERRVASFRLIDLSQPYACVYRKGSYLDNHKSLRMGRCFNAGEEETFDTSSDNWDFYKDVISVSVSPGAELHIWTEDNDTDDSSLQILPDPNDNRDPKDWWESNFPDGSLQRKIVQVKVVAVPLGETFNLKDYFEPAEREFQYEGIYHSVYQTNGRAEAFSEPASYDACHCSSYYTALCAELGELPQEITVKNLAMDKGTIECDGARFKDRCTIPYPADQELDVLLRAIPYPGYTFAWWKNDAGTQLHNTYSPGPGETIYAGFSTMLDACDSSDGWIFYDTIPVITLDRADTQEGSASLHVVGHVDPDRTPTPISLQKVFSQPVNSGVTEGGYLHLWLYLPKAGAQSGTIEISSSGEATPKRYKWTLGQMTELQQGWNELFLRLDEHAHYGDDNDPPEVPDLKQINFFKFFAYIENRSVYKFDDIYFLPQLPISTDATVLDLCEDTDGWNGVGLSNASQEGDHSVAIDQNSAARTLARTFDSPVHARVSEDGYLHVWLYVSDETIGNVDFAGNGQIEISSSGGPDQHELHWVIKPDLTAGWNELYLKLSEANETGGPADLTAINYFRLHGCTGTCRIDDIYFIQEKP